MAIRTASTLQPPISGAMVSLYALLLCALMLPQHCEGFEAFLANATSPTISPNTPHIIDRYYYKPSFDFTAEICNRSPLTESCTIDPSCRGKIVVGVDHANAITPCPIIELLFYDCKAIGCAGLIEIWHKTPEAGHWVASSTWSTRRDYHRHRVVPRVVMAVTPSGDTGVKESDVEWIMEHWNDTGLIIHMWSGEHNAADDVLVSPLFLFVNIFVNLQSSFNIYQVSIKIIAFHRSKKKPPKAFFWILFPELFANIMRVMTFTSLTSALITPIFGSWGMYLPWEIFRIILTAPSDLGNISNAAITLILFDTYSAISASTSTAQFNQARYITYGIAGGTAGMAAASLILSIYSAIDGDELIPTEITAGIVLLLSLPLTWAFIRFGGIVAREMRKGNSSVKMSEEKRKDRENFGRRVKLSGIAMIVNIIAMVSFVLFSAYSSSHFLNLMQAMIFTANFVSGAQILAVRVPRDPRRTIAPAAAAVAPSITEHSNKIRN